MLGIGVGELLLIGAVVLVVVGPEQLPRMMRSAGRHYGQLRRSADEIRRAFTLEADRMDAQDRAQDFQRRREAALQQRQAAESRGSVSQSTPHTPTEEASHDEE
jgi:sec-independent protein translocase protein TatB